jgi:hypothetical protein
MPRLSVLQRQRIRHLSQQIPYSAKQGILDPEVGILPAFFAAPGARTSVDRPAGHDVNECYAAWIVRLASRRKLLDSERGANGAVNAMAIGITLSRP